MRLIIDDTLTRVVPHNAASYAMDIEHDRARILQATIKPDNAGEYDYKLRKKIGEKEVTLQTTVQPNEITHTNYLNYLCKAYASHERIVVTPDILWYTILCEIAAAVVKNPTEYSHLFTTTPDEKQEILVPGLEMLNLEAVMDALRTRVPTAVDDFLPEFTTTT